MKETEIWAYLNGQASEETRRNIERWMDSEAFDKETFDELEQLWRSMEEAVPLPEDEHRALKYSTLRKRRSRQARDRIFHFARYAAAALLVIAAAFWLAHPSNEILFSKSKQLASNHFSGKQYLRLPDGTSVLLNKDSELKYGGTFGTNQRVVFLEGEGFFDVAHDLTRPFIVYAGDVKTTVLGTAFNVQAYHDRPEVVVTVTRGKVRVGDEERVYGELLPDEQLAVNHENKTFEKITVNAEEELAWKDEFLVLDNLSMGEAAELIGNHFDVQVVIANPALREEKVTGTFLKEEGLKYIVMMISRTMQAEYSIERDTVFIEGGVVRERMK